ncbi:UNVERIFIED_CONTAM: Mce-associated membrane protein [Williamsia faeni]
MTKIDTTDLAVLEAEALAEAAEASAVAARARARAAQLRRRSEESSTDSEVADEAVPDTAATVAAPEEVDTEDLGAEDLGAEDLDTEDVALDEDTDKGPASHRRWTRLRRPGKRAIATALAAVVIVAALGLSGYLAWQHREVTKSQDLEAEFDAAARQGVVTLTSLDFNQAAADVQRVLDNSTGAFLTEFQSRADDFTSVVEQSQVTTKGQVNASAVESMTDDSAVVLVAATSEVTNAAGAKEEPRSWRLSVTVNRVDGDLKMSKVEFVP